MANRKPAEPTDGGAFEVARVERRSVERTITTTGSLLPLDRTPVSVKVAGRISEIAVDLGSVVRKGDLIAQVEDADYALRVRQAEAALWQARAQAGLPLEGNDDGADEEASSAVTEARAVLDEARANRDRILALSQQGILSASELETANATFKVASSRYEEALEQARTRMAQVKQRRAEYWIAAKQQADTRILAPYDGAVQERLANVGEYLAVGAPVVTLVRTDPLRLRVEVSEREAPRVKIGQSVRVTLERDTNVYSGEVKRLSPAIVEGSRTLVVEADVPSQGRLRPGSYARAEIVTTGEVPTLTVRPEAVLTFAGIEKVFVTEGGLAVEKRVTTGDRGRGWVEVVAGLREGESAVLSPGSLQAGQKITVLSGKTTATPPAAVTESRGTGEASRRPAGS
ncbi:MAG: efflux RND transporter periplasmic adaptor subunit [Verrucomicrobiales bacterium]|nr:efflux RND transporter periplasmic adaptor subunit [Verrucomicrobiales bacterium]